MAAGKPYTIRRSQQYLAELEKLAAAECEADEARCEELFSDALDRIAASPHAAYFMRSRGCYLFRVPVLVGILWVDIWYTVDDEAEEVMLIRVRAVDRMGM